MCARDVTHACAVWIAGGEAFQGCGFLVAPGLVATAAHVVRGGRGGDLVIHHASGTHKVLPGDVRAWPPDQACDQAPDQDRGQARDQARHPRFHPYPDLALLKVPGWVGHPIADLATADPAPGLPVAALGFSMETPTPGVQPDTLRLHVAGPSGKYRRLLGDGVRPGFSGSMLLGPDGATVGVLKGSRDYRSDRGGWLVPVSALREVLHAAGHGQNLRREPPPSPSDSELVESLLAFPSLGRQDGRQDLLEAMGRNLGMPYAFEVDERAGRREHLGRLVHRCRHYRDERAALRAMYDAMAELAPHDRALDQLGLLVRRAVGDRAGDE
ncbi:trypsin-like peptidase domain-containing protein [Streptomyces odontomachi]|uniref:trypsin-like peptidase domain-containing protein n=1 Tax=Streptomyces odontomachi TaxID=2944940 RepID=UPI00210A8800|nr:trypsin-like peptidase domain-containing protein [Streptomyces sp. ODS25]